MLREEAVDMDLGAERYTAYERKSTIVFSPSLATQPVACTTYQSRARA
jgi:hypothetical protein